MGTRYICAQMTLLLGRADVRVIAQHDHHEEHRCDVDDGQRDRGDRHAPLATGLDDGGDG